MKEETEDEFSIAEEYENETKSEADIEKEDKNKLAAFHFRELLGHTDCVSSIQLFGETLSSTNEQTPVRVLSGSHDATCRLWDATLGKDCLLRTYMSHKKRVLCVRVTTLADRFASCGWDRLLHVWDIESGKILWSTPPQEGIVTTCCFSRDGSQIACGSDLDGAFHMWDAASGKLVLRVNGQHASTVSSVLLTSHGDRVLTGSYDRLVKSFDLRAQRTTLVLQAHSNAVSCASLSPEERLLATGSWDKTLRLWDVSTGMYRSQGAEMLEKGHEGSVSSCAFSTDGTQLVSGSYDGTFIVWDVEHLVKRFRVQDGSIKLCNIEHSDQLPAVIESSRSIGLKLLRCQQCGRPFSIAATSDPRAVTRCVFCRLHGADREAPASLTAQAAAQAL